MLLFFIVVDEIAVVGTHCCCFCSFLFFKILLSCRYPEKVKWVVYKIYVLSMCVSIACESLKGLSYCIKKK